MTPKFVPVNSSSSIKALDSNKNDKSAIGLVIKTNYIGGGSPFSKKMSKIFPIGSNSELKRMNIERNSPQSNI